jgi:exodeoxyribonuclease III
MKIATYNVNGVNGRLPVLVRWLEQSQPDVVCLQELKAPEERFPIAAIEKAGYGAIWHGQKSWNGVAILSRGRQPEETKRGLPGDPDDSHSRYIEANVEYAKKLLTLDGAVILAGDYNVIPTELDAYKPERWIKDALFFPESRAAYQKLLAQGWTDAIRKLQPDEAIYTFWDYFRNAYARNAGIRIDHFLLNDQAAATLASAGVDREVRGWEKTSDHAPTWIKLTVKIKKSTRRIMHK